MTDDKNKKNFGFEYILSNEPAKQKLQHTILTQQIPHALILVGEKGMGKSSLAGAYAKTLQCEKKGTTPCHTCKSCQTFDSFNHPDVFWIRPEKQTLGVNEVREKILAPMKTKPYAHPYKIFIIESAETLTIAAQNALLKTIEEPALFGVFIFLTTHTHHFLPTILSRCIAIPMQYIPSALLVDTLVNNYTQEEEQAKFIDMFAQGVLGKAIMYATDEEFLSLKSLLEEKMDTLLRTEDLLLAFQMGTIIEPYKHRIEDVFDILVHYFRKKLFDSPHMIVYTQYIELIMEAKQALSYHGNYTMVMDILFASFIHI